MRATRISESVGRSRVRAPFRWVLRSYAGEGVGRGRSLVRGRRSLPRSPAVGRIGFFAVGGLRSLAGGGRPASLPPDPPPNMAVCFLRTSKRKPQLLLTLSPRPFSEGLTRLSLWGHNLKSGICKAIFVCVTFSNLITSTGPAPTQGRGSHKGLGHKGSPWNSGYNRF